MDNYKNREFIDPSRGYLYIALAEHEVKENKLGHENWLVIPDGAELMTAAGKEFVFWKGNGQYSWHTENSNEWEKAGFGLSDLESYLDEYSKIVWERNKQVEKDPALISGADALRSLIEGLSVEMSDSELGMDWTEICVKHDDFRGKVEPCLWMFLNQPEHIEFRLKPQTIKLELELPKPFEPKNGEIYWFVDSTERDGYLSVTFHDDKDDHKYVQFGAYRTEEEIKQVVEQLRKIRGTNS